MSDNQQTSTGLPARRGLILILSSPSGAGKTTLARRLLHTDDNLRLSVSVTTRPPREGETDGVDYWFVDKAEFERRRDNDELLEWAEVFGNYYGTPRAPIEGMIERGRDILFDIDWQGAQQLAEKITRDLVRVFILPPSGHVLRNRLVARGLDTDQVVQQRMARASEEISHWGEYDYVIVNDNLERSDRLLTSILIAERQKRDRIVGLPDFVRGLQSSL